MKRGNAFFRSLLAAATFCMAPAWAHAQDENAPPKPAARSTLPGIDLDADQPTNQDALRPDNNPLTGIQSPTVGQQDLRHSYWVPGFQYANTAQSSSYSGPSTGWTDTNYLIGNLTLLQAWGRSQLSLNYSGGGYFSTDAVQGNGQFHQLSVVQAFEWERWQLQFFDQFAYLPQTQYGFGGGTPLGLPGIGGSLGISSPGLETGPNQSILNGAGPRYNNTLAAQASYALSRRSSVTVAGSYGLLHFVQAGNIDSNQASANAGYNYTLTAVDTIGVNYRFTTFHFAGNPQALGDHVISAVYGRKITGRLGLKLSGGPEITTFRVPIGGKTRQISGSAAGALSYAFANGGISVGFTHGVSGGSGVFTGANTSEVYFNLDRNLTRLWHGYVNFGYARNGVIVNGSGGSQSYNSWFGGGGVSRPLGRNANLTFGYNAQVQSYSSATTTQHQINMSFQWHTRPYVLR